MGPDLEAGSWQQRVPVRSSRRVGLTDSTGSSRMAGARRGPGERRGEVGGVLLPGGRKRSRRQGQTPTTASSWSWPAREPLKRPSPQRGDRLRGGGHSGAGFRRGRGSDPRSRHRLRGRQRCRRVRLAGSGTRDARGLLGTAGAYACEHVRAHTCACIGMCASWVSVREARVCVCVF